MKKKVYPVMADTNVNDFKENGFEGFVIQFTMISSNGFADMYYDGTDKIRNAINSIPGYKVIDGPYYSDGDEDDQSIISKAFEKYRKYLDDEYEE